MRGEPLGTAGHQRGPLRMCLTLKSTKLPMVSLTISDVSGVNIEFVNSGAFATGFTYETDGTAQPSTKSRLLFDLFL